MRISLFRHFAGFISIILPPTRLLNLHFRLWRVSGLILGSNVRICGNTKVFGRGELFIGDNTWLSPGTTFMTNEKCQIKIGANCDIGPYVTFVTGGHKIGESYRRAGSGKAMSIEIGDGAWIGARTTILHGVRIGRGVVVAAGSLVHRDIPDNTLVAGVPAVLKRHLD